MRENQREGGHLCPQPHIPDIVVMAHVRAEGFLSPGIVWMVLALVEQGRDLALVAS